MALIEIADVLVEGDELRECSAEFDEFAKRASEARARGEQPPDAFRFEGGSARAEHLPLGSRESSEELESIDLAASPGGEPFKPIGIGKPLSVEIHNVYVGDLPKASFGRTPDVLLSSAARSWATADASPRALNRLAANVTRRSPVDFPTFEPGTRLVYYSKAMTDDSTSLTVEMIADSFPKEAFDQVSSMLSTASGIPVFTSASLYLLAGSLFVKAIGSLGEKLSDGHAFFSDTLDMLFSTPGVEAAQPRKALLLNRGTEAEFQGKYAFAPGSYEVVSKADGTPYAGAAPFVAVAINGATIKSYEGFQPTAVTTALLDRFYHANGGANDLADTLREAMQLYNDSKFAERAKAVHAQFAAHADDTEEGKKARELFAAYLANIQNEAIRKQVEEIG